MAGSRKHGAHRFDLSLPALAAGTAADTSNVFPYDAYAEGATTATAWSWPYDVQAEELFEACYTLEAAYTGQATNFSSICLRLIRAAAVLNDLRVVYSSSGVTSAAFTLSNVVVAAGAAVPNTGTGTLTLQTGVVLPWTLAQGDIIQLLRLSTGTGQATPAIGAAFSTRIKGS